MLVPLDSALDSPTGAGGAGPAAAGGAAEDEPMPKAAAHASAFGARKLVTQANQLYCSRLYCNGSIVTAL